MDQQVTPSWVNSTFNALSEHNFTTSDWPQSSFEAAKQGPVTSRLYASAYQPRPTRTVKNGQLTPPDDLSRTESTKISIQIHTQAPLTEQPKQTQCDFTNGPPSPESPQHWTRNPTPPRESAQSPIEAARCSQLVQLPPGQFINLQQEFGFPEDSKNLDDWEPYFPGSTWSDPSKQPEIINQETLQNLFPDLNLQPEQPDVKPKRRRQTKRTAREASPKPTAESPQPKRRRGRPKSQPPAMDQSALTASRETHLEKNRVAAHKCRQRKKEFIQSLESRAQDGSIRNKQLKSQVDGLKEELLLLKNQLLGHANCGDINIDRYLKQSASNIINMDLKVNPGASTGTEESHEWAQTSPLGGTFSIYSNEESVGEMPASINTPIGFDPSETFFDIKQ
jgi:hypothetical protein